MVPYQFYIHVGISENPANLTPYTKSSAFRLQIYILTIKASLTMNNSSISYWVQGKKTTLIDTNHTNY
jgi:hypothetical protein